MAISGNEVEIIGPGIRQLEPEKSSYVQNMVFNNGAWEVRKGFGTVGEWDSTLSSYTENPGTLVGVEGYKKHLGSYLMVTDFEHRQIISVFVIDGWTSDGKADGASSNNIFNTSSRRAPMYAVSIYDITTDTRWEEILHKQTSERASTDPNLLPATHGYYESNRTRIYSNPINANDAKQINFAEFNDILFFGNESTGVHYYKPAAFVGNRSKAIDAITNSADADGYSESSLIVPLVLSPGVFSAKYDYLTVIPTIKAVATLGNRLVYITRNSLFFSDANYPTSVVTGHILDIPSEKPVTACKEINGNLLIWTESETYLYQPVPSFFVHQGQLTKISENVGCLSPNSLVKYENTIVWVDINGIYQNTGGLNVQNISENVKPFFTEYLQNPLSNYNTAAGTPVLANTQPPIQYSLDPENVTVAYSHSLKNIMINVPNKRCTLVFNKNGEWSIWTYDSVTTQNVLRENEVGTRFFMDCQQLLAEGTDIFCVGLDGRVNNQILVDNTSTINRVTGVMEADVNRNQRFNNYFICRYGRGGGCDRNSNREDRRYGIGEWVSKPISSTGIIGTNKTIIVEKEFDFILGKPEKVAPGFTIDGKVFGSEGGVLLPVMVRVPRDLLGVHTPGSRLGQQPGSERVLWQDENITRMDLTFDFDSVHWAVLLDTGTPRIKTIHKTPLENIQSGTGGTTNGWAMTANNQIQLVDAVTGLPSTSGNRVRFTWDILEALNGGLTFGMQHFRIPNTVLITTGATPYTPIPVSSDTLTTLFWIPLSRKVSADAVSSMGIEGMQGSFHIDLLGGVPLVTSEYYISRNYCWAFSSFARSSTAHIEDNVAQAVDWAYLTGPVGLKEGQQIKARGLYTQLASQGTANSMIDNGWSDQVTTISPRLFNTVVSSDNAQWQGQVIDQGAAIDDSPLYVPGSGDQNSIRTRVRDVNQVMQHKTFSNAANTWGQDGSGTNGTVLIDDPQYGEIAESNSTRGEWVNWLFFGHVLDKAEKLVINSAKAIIRRVSGRRRRGR